MKIIALQNNYSNTANLSDEEIYLMADSSLAKSGKPWFLPDFSPEFTYRTHIVFRIGRLGKNIARRFAPRYIDAVTVGATISAAGINHGAISQAFDGAAMIGDFVAADNLADIIAILSNDDFTTSLSTGEMIYKIDEIIEYVSKFFTLKIGDIIYSGFGSESGTLEIGQHLRGTINGNEVLNISIK